MDLWIRSQDRDYLEKVEKIYLWENSFGDYQIDGKSELGTYKTKERALEVLDEIQTQLVTLNYQYLHRGEHFIATESNVYEMPEE